MTHEQLILIENIKTLALAYTLLFVMGLRFTLSILLMYAHAVDMVNFWLGVFLYLISCKHTIEVLPNLINIFNLKD